MSRNAPSIQPRYQSGCAAVLTADDLNGPYSQIGLICARPPRSARTPATSAKSPALLAAYVGHRREPTTLSPARARPAERAREEHAAEVQDDGGDEHQRGPVVDLSHDETGAHVEAEANGRPIGLRHAYALQRRVMTVVGDGLVAGDEEERQVDPGE